MEDKKSLTLPFERALIKGKASLLAALDYYISIHSDIFISASPGNMHNALVSSPLVKIYHIYESNAYALPILVTSLVTMLRPCSYSTIHYEMHLAIQTEFL
jgi:hypothetical protein